MRFFPPYLKAGLIAGVFCWPTLSAAGFIIEPEGPSGSGLNDTAATAIPLGTLSPGSGALGINGFIDDGNENDVDFFSFLVSGGPLGVLLDIDFADDFGSTGNDDIGLDAELSVFNAAGELIAEDDDSDLIDPDPGSDPFGDLDPFIGVLTLLDGLYFAAVHYSGNDPVNIDTELFAETLSLSGEQLFGSTPGTNFTNDAFCLDPVDEGCVGPYQLIISAVPVWAPGSLALFGFGGLLLLARRRSRSQ